LEVLDHKVSRVQYGKWSGVAFQKPVIAGQKMGAWRGLTGSRMKSIKGFHSDGFKCESPLLYRRTQGHLLAGKSKALLDRHCWTQSHRNSRGLRAVSRS